MERISPSLECSVSATGADDKLERGDIKDFETGEDLCYVPGSVMSNSDGQKHT
jgi:hypothetical protein